MKTGKLIILACIAAIATISSCAIRKSEPLTGTIVDTTDERIKNGEVAFMTHCHKCHPQGEGGLGPALNTLHLAPGFVKRFQMRHGLGVMPGFNKEEISKRDLHDISKYLRRLQQLDTKNNS